MKKRYTFYPKNWLRAGLFTAFAATLSLTIQAQTAPVKLWDKTFGGNDDDRLTSLQQTSDGGYILGGWSASGISGDKTQASQGSKDYWVIKLDANGNKTWDKTFGGNANEELTSLRQTSDGGFILGGWTDSGISGDKTQASQGSNDYWIVKLDGSGNKIWDKTFGGSGDDRLTSLQQTSDGGYILGGRSDSGVTGDKTQASKGGYGDYWILKLDALGNKTWDKTWGGSGSDHLFSLQQTSDGGYILGGQSASGTSGDKSQASKGGADFWVIKLDGLGNKTWDKTLGGSDQDVLYSLQQTSDGGYILGGYSQSNISGDKTQASYGGYLDYWVVKLDGSGNKIWDKTFGGNVDDVLLSLQQTSDGGYILGGHSGSGISGDKTQASQGSKDYWVVKLDASGNKTWDKNLGGIGGDDLYSLQQTSDGGFILGGLSGSGISGDKTQASQGSLDYWIVKLGAAPTGVLEAKGGVAFAISPNPSQGRFSLQLSNIAVTKAEVTVSDLLGRVVLQQALQIRNNQISEELTIPNAKGIYLLQLKVGKQIITRKIVVE